MSRLDLADAKWDRQAVLLLLLMLLAVRKGSRRPAADGSLGKRGLRRLGDEYEVVFAEGGRAHAKNKGVRGARLGNKRKFKWRG